MSEQDQKLMERLEEARDLRGQLSGLTMEDQPEIIFQEFSPGRRMVLLWSTETGEEVTIPKYMGESFLAKRRADGKGYRFTAHADQAPPVKRGTVKCFMTF